jgi:hypothetical protein
MLVLLMKLEEQDLKKKHYPTAIKRMGSDNIYHLTWQVDFETGLNLQEQHGIVENYIMIPWI